MKKQKTIAIVDYGVGNLYSIHKALENLGCNAFITEESETISAANAIVLPGVGSFRSGMDGLKLRSLIYAIKDFAKTGKPILGICLGAQLLLSRGFEFGSFKGLDIIPGEVIGFPKLDGKIPHIGWNEIFSTKSWSNSIFSSIKQRSDVYFVHSYILRPDKKSHILTSTTYCGYNFCSAIRKDNIYGCQFHPEKSGQVGLKIIKNFINLI
jgi:imidazole glycerol-phosphate synthase subunit HisH